MKKPLLFIAPIAVLGVLLIILGIFFGYKYIEAKSVSNFEECVARGYPVMESYPEQCKTPDGRLFIREIDEPIEETPSPASEIEVYYPQPEQFIESPLQINGQVPGNWFWEGTFSIDLVSGSGEVLSTVQATPSQGSDWMTDEKVTFQAEIVFDSTTSGKQGTLVLHKANPSGLPENEETFGIIVYFKTAQAKDQCIITGCSGQICSDKDQVTDCAIREEYLCYRSAICERQNTGQCGWTMTEELRQCLEQRGE